MPILNATFAYHSWVSQPKWILPNAIHSVASIRLITCGHMHLAVYNKIKPKLINNSIASALKCGLNILRKLETKVESLLFFFHVIIHLRLSYLSNFFIFSFPVLWLSTYTSLSIQNYCKLVSSTFTQTSWAKKTSKHTSICTLKKKITKLLTCSILHFSWFNPVSLLYSFGLSSILLRDKE